VSPRPYHLGKRQTQIDASRRRVIDAARSLLSEASTYPEFTLTPSIHPYPVRDLRRPRRL